MMRLADYIISRIVNAGVNVVFQVTGRGTLFLSDAIAKHKRIKPVSLHHEQACAFAAIGYAEKTNGLGMALVSTGCGSTNAITGVLSAWQDGVPCIFVSGQHNLNETTNFTGIPLRTYGQQEADIVKLVEPITKFCHMITKPDEIETVMDQALKEALSGRKGPVWIDVPLDLQSALVTLDPTNKPLQADSPDIDILEDDIAYIQEALEEAERPVVLIGKGIRSANVEKEFIDFVIENNLPVVYTASSPDTFGSRNELSIGSLGAMGCSRAAALAVANCDLLLVLGSRLNSLTTGSDFCKFARAAKVVVVDIDPQEHAKKTIRIDRFIEADLAKIFGSKLFNIRQPKRDEKWLVACKNWKSRFSTVETDFKSEEAVDLYELAAQLSEKLPNPSSLVTDSGLIEVILPTNIMFNDGTKCIHPASQGAMGFSLPAAIGASYASGDPVVVVVGDGSIMMNLQELQSINYLKLPIKIFVINNNMYSIIRKRQKDLFRNRTIGTDQENGVGQPDFESVAACFGLYFTKVINPSQLSDSIRQVLSKPGPVLCEIIGRHDQGYIEIAHVRSAINKRIVRRPIEDQKPFLDQVDFLKQMIIPPIDQ